jgi:hypothetical protein
MTGGETAKGAAALHAHHLIHNASGACTSGLAGGWARVGTLEGSTLRRITLDPMM